MDQIKEAEDKRQELVDELDVILTAATDEKREVTDDEDKRYEEADKEIKALDKTIKRLKEKEDRDKIAAIEAAKNDVHVAGEEASKGEEKELDKMNEEVSLRKMMAVAAGFGKLEGREKEMDEEAHEEIRGQKFGYKGVAVPGKMLGQADKTARAKLEKRTDIDQATSDIAPIGISAYAEAIRQNGIYPTLIPEANTFHGLTADQRIISVGAQALTWSTAENSAAADGGTNFGKDLLSPERLTGFVDIGNEVLIQNGESTVINHVMADLGRESAVEIDKAIFSTASVTNTFTSIGATTSVKTFTEAATYAAPSSTVRGTVTDDVIEAMQTMASADGLTGRFAFVGHAKLMTDLHNAARVAGVMPLSQLPGEFNAPNVFNVSGVPFYLTTANTSNGTTSADFVGGNFNRTYIGFFGGLDMVLDPWTVLVNDQVRIVVHRRLDFSLILGAAFVKSTTLLS